MSEPKPPTLWYSLFRDGDDPWTPLESHRRTPNGEGAITAAARAAWYSRQGAPVTLYGPHGPMGRWVDGRRVATPPDPLVTLDRVARHM